MIQSLKRKYFILSFFAACALWAVSAIILICNIDNVRILLEKPVDFNELMAEDIKEGVRVNASINLIYDYYSYYEEDGKTVSKEYLLPIGNAEYMGMVCTGSDMEDADAVMQVYWDYEDGKDVSKSSVQPLQVTGTIMPLEGESLRFYRQYIDEIGWTEEEKQKFLPYALMVGSIGSESTGGLILCGIFFLAAFALGVVLVISGARGSNVKMLEKYCSEKGNRDLYMQRIEAFYCGGTPVQGIRINTEYFMVVKNVSLCFAEIGKILWVYPNVVRHRVNGIPVGKTHSLIVKMADGKQFDIHMKNEAAVNEAMQYVAQNMPYLILGYDAEIMRVYSKNRMEMINTVAERRQEYLNMSEDKEQLTGNADMTS